MHYDYSLNNKRVKTIYIFLIYLIYLIYLANLSISGYIIYSDYQYL